MFSRLEGHKAATLPVAPGAPTNFNYQIFNLNKKKNQITQIHINKQNKHLNNQNIQVTYRKDNGLKMWVSLKVSFNFLFLVGSGLLGNGLMGNGFERFYLLILMWLKLCLFVNICKIKILVFFLSLTKFLLGVGLKKKFLCCPGFNYKYKKAWVSVDPHSNTLGLRLS